MEVFKVYIFNIFRMFVYLRNTLIRFAALSTNGSRSKKNMSIESPSATQQDVATNFVKILQQRVKKEKLLGTTTRGSGILTYEGCSCWKMYLIRNLKKTLFCNVALTCRGVN